MWRLPSGIKRFPFLGDNKVGAMSKEPKHQVEGIIKSLLTKLHHSLPVKYPSGRFQTSVKNISGRFQPNFKLLQLLVFSQERELKEMACLSFACSCWQFCKTEECDRFGFSPSFFFSSSSLLLAQPLPGRVASKRFATILSGIMFRQKICSGWRPTTGREGWEGGWGAKRQKYGFSPTRSLEGGADQTTTAVHWL